MVYFYYFSLSFTKNIQEGNNMSKICCFIGHRNVKKTTKLREKLTDTVRWLITEKEVDKKIWHGIYKGVNVCTEKEKNVSFIQE